MYDSFSSSYDELLVKAGLTTLELARTHLILTYVYKCVNNLTPSFLGNMFINHTSNYNLRNKNLLKRANCRTVKNGSRSLSDYGCKLWNELTDTIKNAKNLNDFRRQIVNWKPNKCLCKLCVKV